MTPTGGGAHRIVPDVQGQAGALADAAVLAEVFERSIVGIALADAEGSYLRANPEFCRLTGYSEQELLGQTIAHTLDAEVDTPFDPGEPRSDEQRFLRADGRVVRARVTRRWIQAPGTPPSLLLQVEDLESRRHAERLARARAERQATVSAIGRRALRGVALGVLLDEAAAAVAEGLQVSPAATHWVLHDPPPAGETREGDPKAAVLAIPVLVGEKPGEKPFATFELRTPRERVLTLEELQFVHEVVDVVAAAVERKQAEERIRHDAHHDQLTGLANRGLLVDRLQLALARMRRSGGQVAVLFCDLDRFKVINDSLGHAAGDALLVEVASRLRTTLRLEDTIARIGGDEFVLICGDLASDEEAELIAERVRAALSQPHLVGSREVFAPPSIGVALAPGPAIDPEDLIADADLAMYHAKERGRGQWAMFSAVLRGDPGRVELESSLRHALERNELRVEYQPVIDLAAGRIIGAEALVRWQHPTQGVVAPLDFIRLAEETGLIVPIGEWILGEACRQAVRWGGLPTFQSRPFLISVNVSARQVAGGHFARSVGAALAASGLDPGSLALELTETFLMQDSPATVTAHDDLRRSGIRIAVDDFGTGYSSLAYLKRLPIDRVKIDRSFIAGLGPEAEDSAIVAAVVSLARNMGLEVVAEGVETPAQLNRLRALGCQAAQGFWMSRPMPPAALDALLADDPRW